MSVLYPTNTVKPFTKADGFAKHVVGARLPNMQVRRVTNLEDTGVGSLRWALDTEVPTFVVFAVAGYIIAESAIPIRSNKRILGQTAPGVGITVRKNRLSIQEGSTERNNIIVGYIRSRFGTESGKEQGPLYARRGTDWLFHNCSFSWSVDEAFTISAGCRNVTIQDCIISESLHGSIHSKGPHGFSMVIDGRDMSFHHNLIIHHDQRMPMFSHPDNYGSYPDALERFRGVCDYRNNIHYNCRFRFGNGGAGGTYNMVRNLWITGPAKLLESVAFLGQTTGSPILPRIYLEGNEMEINGIVNTFPNQKNLLNNSSADRDFITQLSPFPANVYEQDYSIAQAYVRVVAQSGASFRRDAIDNRLVNTDLVNRTTSYTGSVVGAPGILDTVEDGEGWISLPTTPVLPNEIGAGYAEAKGNISDQYKSLRGLDLATNWDLVEAPTRRVWLEEYANWLVGDDSFAETFNTLTITVNNSKWGSTNLIGGDFAPSQLVNLTANPAFGYKFIRWRRVSDNSTVSVSAAITYIMPSVDVTLEAVFSAITSIPDNSMFFVRNPTINV